MDRAYNNLEALTEEDGEEEGFGWEDHSNIGRIAPSLLDEEDESSQEEGQDSSDDDEDEEERREPNKFDNLCDGVFNANALVQASLVELIEFKDELLRHAIPPSVLVRLALVTSRVYRSVSDLQMPTNELIRMVRVYSTPWEEKSTALKKLHQDYESKQRQLNIAIKRLQLVDAHSKRIAREKRLMNWEKLFSKLTSAKGHGRRWKFLIESIKEKAKLGLEHVHEYARALEESSDEEDHIEEGVESRLSGKQGTEAGLDDHDTVTEAPTEVSATPAERADSDEDSKDKDTTVDGSESDSEGHHSDANQSEKAGQDIAITLTADSDHSSDYSRSGSAKRVRFEDSESLPIMEKPPMTDQATWTNEPEYDRTLHMRVYAPKGLTEEQICCVISLGNQVHKTGVLDRDLEEEEPEESTEKKAESQKSTSTKTEAKGKPDEKGDHSGKDIVEEIKIVEYYEEYSFAIPEDHSGVPGSKPSENPQLRVAVNHGPNEEMVAMATINYDVIIKSMEIPTIDFPPPKGDEPTCRLLVDVDVSELQETETESVEDKVKALTPTLFPLYSLRSGKGPCGDLPLVLYWGQRLRPRSFHRQTGTLGINELVYDLTGVDLDVTTKEDLMKEYRDEALSAIAFTPEPKEETVTREEYDRMMERHKDELIMLQDEYETRLQGLMDNLRSMPTAQPPTGHKEGQRSISAGSRGFPERTSVQTSPINFDMNTEDNSNTKQPRPPSSQKPKKNFRVGRPLPKWGTDIPQDFLSRLEKYEAETMKHKQALSDKLWQEISRDIERKLAGQHKLNECQTTDGFGDVSLPALFMPFKTGNVFNPRAHQYFHPKGSNHMRLTQPPSVFQLPPLPQNKLAVVNLFNLSRNFQQPPPSWLMERYIEQQNPTPQGAPPSTPALHGASTSMYTAPFPTMVKETSGSAEQSQSYLPVTATSKMSKAECET